jgi:hypothetical protein
MADQFDVFKKEVEEDLQRERLQKLFETYKVYIAGAAAAIVLGVGGVKFLEARRIAAAEATGERFTRAVRQLNDKNPAEAQTALEAIALGSGGYAALAQIRLAGTHAEAGRIAEAVAAYEALSRQERLDPLIADFARLQTAMLKADTADWTDMQNRLTDLMREGNPWRHAARELLGMVAHKAGKSAEARAEFETLLGDRATPAGIAERVAIMMALMTQADMTAAQGTKVPGTRAPGAPEPKKQ